MKKLFPILLISLILQTTSSAQNIDPIQTDRPDQTECPFIVPDNYIQMENGFLFEKQMPGLTNYFHPSTLWKYGINDKLELRFITELVTTKNGNETFSGLRPVTIGFKVNLWEERGIIPMTSFIGHLKTSNIGSRILHTNFYAPSFKFAMQHNLTEKITLGYNLGADWNGVSPEPTFVYTLATGRSIMGNLGGYVEVYGFMPQESRSDHRFDGGLTYLLSSDLLLDLSAGTGLTNNAPDYFIAFGISFRFHCRPKTADEI